MKKLLLLLAFAMPAQLRAQTTRFNVEIDPSTYIFKGYSGNLSYQLNERWLIGAATFSLEFPNVLVKLAIDPGPGSTTLKLKSGYTAFLHRSLSADRSAFFVGLQTGVSNFKLSDDRVAGQTRKYTAGLFIPRFGYKYYVGQSNFYLMPWAGLTYVYVDDKTQRLGGLSYDVKPLLPFGAVHLGYSF
ncbi:hypothetical protein [Hymenobacter terrenus]|uniref:hypothetical protein n=1 Tax=Hymenobacter terrenus TaxID=1629124 RepID=UPI0006199663|nr:hypothetical protein [Hymenobacter terrenus]